MEFVQKDQHLICNFFTNIFSRLYLNNNMIADVGRGTFAAITRIGTIDLARNELQKIDYQMFASLNYIEVTNHIVPPFQILSKSFFL